MAKENGNQFYFQPNYGLFIGQLNDNVPHRHYAIQLSVCPQKVMQLTVDGIKKNRSSFFLPSYAHHQLIIRQTHLTILINPISQVGYCLQLLHQSSEDFKLTKTVSEDLTALVQHYQMTKIEFVEFCSRIDLLFAQLVRRFEQRTSFKDDRIAKAILYLNKHFDRQVSVEEIAQVCFLSPSRFLHLFKEKTKTTFRKYKLWTKVVKSLPSLRQQSITQTAHEFGFTDSSHYTRTFKETFGVTPKYTVK